MRVRFSEIVPPLDPDAASRFLRAWHGSLPDDAEDEIRLFLLPARRGLGVSVVDATDTLRETGLDGLVHPGAEVEGYPSQNVYHVCSRVRPGLPPTRKGGDRDTTRSPGFWADLDVKQGGGFDSQGAILAALEPLSPSILVGSGSGGVHAYWTVSGGLSPSEASEHCERVRLWLQERTGVAVDKVSEPSRMLRLPGTLRLPKRGDADASPGAARPVELLHVGSGVDPAGVRALTQASWESAQARIRKTRERRAELDARGEDALRVALAEHAHPGRGRWAVPWALAHAEELFSARVSWAEILEPAGWTRYGMPDDEGRQAWTRPGPGASPRSLVTDWAESPDVASLFSLAPETGLRDAHDAGALTKARVAAELTTGGDVGLLLWRFVRSGVYTPEHTPEESHVSE